MNTQPNICNLCGGKVIYTSNALIYGREYGSGKMYYCMECGAYVGTHKPRPKEALGLLANAEMRDMKMKCHDLFDKKWNNEANSKRKHEARKLAYEALAEKIDIPLDECHFGYFDLETLEKAYKILRSEKVFEKEKVRYE